MALPILEQSYRISAPPKTIEVQPAHNDIQSCSPPNVVEIHPPIHPHGNLDRGLQLWVGRGCHIGLAGLVTSGWRGLPLWVGGGCQLVRLSAASSTCTCRTAYDAWKVTWMKSDTHHGLEYNVWKYVLIRKNCPADEKINVCFHSEQSPQRPLWAL